MTDESETIVPGEVKLCQECGVRPSGFGMFGRYCEECRDNLREAKASRQARNEPSAPKRPRAVGNIGTLEREIREAMMGTAAVLAISNPGIFVAVEATVDEFAVAWANVARTSPTAERYIRALLTGGVWIIAMSATLTMVVAVMVATGSTPPRLVPLGYYVMGRSDRLREYVVMMQTPPMQDESEDLAA